VGSIAGTRCDVLILSDRALYGVSSQESIRISFAEILSAEWSDSLESSVNGKVMIVDLVRGSRLYLDLSEEALDRIGQILIGVAGRTVPLFQRRIDMTASDEAHPRASPSNIQTAIMEEPALDGFVRQDRLTGELPKGPYARFYGIALQEQSKLDEMGFVDAHYATFWPEKAGSAGAVRSVLRLVGRFASHGEALKAKEALMQSERDALGEHLIGEIRDLDPIAVGENFGWGWACQMRRADRPSYMTQYGWQRGDYVVTLHVFGSQDVSEMAAPQAVELDLLVSAAKEKP